jgi:hypothetical protein
VVDAELAVLDDLLLLLPPQPVIASPTTSGNTTIDAVRFMGASSSPGLLRVKAARMRNAQPLVEIPADEASARATVSRTPSSWT